jgi:hypothetical protein
MALKKSTDASFSLLQGVPGPRQPIWGFAFPAGVNNSWFQPRVA